VTPASASDAPELAALHTAIADHLTREHGRGHWSYRTTEKGTLWALQSIDPTQNDYGDVVAGQAAIRKVIENN